MERTGRDEENMVRLDRAMLGVDGGALDQRQQVALHALARDIGSAQPFPAGDLVDLVEEHDAILLDRANGFLNELVAVEQLVGLLIDEDAVRLVHRNPSRLGAPATDLSENVADIDR